MQSLTDLAIGVPAWIVGYDAPIDFVLRMHELGLVPGTIITVLRKAPLGGTLQVRHGNTVLAIRLSKREIVYIEPYVHSTRPVQHVLEGV